MRLSLIAATTFGLEAVCKREIENLGYEIEKVEDGKVTFLGDERAIVRANLYLRSADRVLIRLDEFEATESETLFQRIKGIPWEEWIPLDGKFVVNCSTVKSKLNSEPKTQSVSEKAIVDRLKQTYPVERFSKTGALYDIKVTILKDRVTLTLDTTGPSLHKRGYRKLNGEAPIKETLASTMVQLSYYREDKVLIDPCCGSGTIPIEAAMIAKNIAPGINRDFSFMDWDIIPRDMVNEERNIAISNERNDIKLKIYGYDIDENAIKIAKINAREAGVEDDIIFEVKDISDLKIFDEYGVIITNPPYGERIGDKESIDKIYKAYARLNKFNPTWSFFIITSDKNIEEKAFLRPADRRRKLYNGRLEVCFYQFHGKAPKREKNF